jgi:hypothetical protein
VKTGLATQITKKSLQHLKIPDIGLKTQEKFHKNPQICFLGEESQKLATLV